MESTRIYERTASLWESTIVRERVAIINESTRHPERVAKRCESTIEPERINNGRRDVPMVKAIGKIYTDENGVRKTIIWVAKGGAYDKK
jgi:hypothetical protein